MKAKVVQWSAGLILFASLNGSAQASPPFSGDGHWAFVKVRCLNGSPEHCTTPTSAIDVVFGATTDTLCLETTNRDDSTKQNYCFRPYEEVQFKHDPNRAVGQSRRVEINSDASIIWVTTSVFEPGRRTDYAYSLHHVGDQLVAVDRIFAARFDSHTRTWKTKREYEKAYYFHR